MFRILCSPSIHTGSLELKKKGLTTFTISKVTCNRYNFMCKLYAFVHLLSILKIVAHYFHSIHSKLQTNKQTILDVVGFVVVTVICTKQFI